MRTGAAQRAGFPGGRVDLIDEPIGSRTGVEVNGLADAVKNPSCTPQDGSVELTVVQFGGGFLNPHAKLEIGPTIITNANAIDLANQIENISKTFI